MCMRNMIVDPEKRRVKTIAWKVLAYSRLDKEYRTPYQCARIKDNKLKTRDKLCIFDSLNDGKTLYGGAIHCFKTREAARNWRKGRPGYRYKIAKVVGTRYVGENDIHIAFREIEFLDKVN